MKLVFATNNKHKVEEVQDILKGLDIELLTLADIGCDADIPEDADTFEGNALQKARYIRDNYHLNCFADDTGLQVKALNWEPGVYSARYAGNHDSEANMVKLLANLQGKDDRTAQFKTAVALIIDDKEYLFEGIVTGHIAEEKSGTAGFGYDPIFVPDGYDKTFSELGSEIKNSISHRGRAIRKLADFLKAEYEK